MAFDKKDNMRKVYSIETLPQDLMDGILKAEMDPKYDYLNNWDWLDTVEVVEDICEAEELPIQERPLLKKLFP